MLVKLQRPPPEIRIFLPARSAWSSKTTRRPRRPASSAHIMPAAPAPSTTTSTFCTLAHRPRLAGRSYLKFSSYSKFGFPRVCDHGLMVRKQEDRGPRVAAGQAHGPAAAITRRAADRLRAGHLWVYRSDIESLVPPVGATDLQPGALITVMDSRGIPLGTGLYSAASQIAVRIVSNEAALPRAAYLEQLRERV